MPIVFHPRGRQPISVNQPQGGSLYPFVECSDDIRELVADFYLSVSSADLLGWKPPAVISWIHGFGEDPSPEYFAPVHAHDLIVRDAEENLIFDTRAADRYWTSVWDDRLLVVEWIRTHQVADNPAKPGVCRIVVHTAWSPDHPQPRTYPLQMLPARAVLDERTVIVQPMRVTSIKVFDSITEQDLRFDRYQIELDLGYNMRADVENLSQEGRKHWRVTLHAEPGAGIGKAPCLQPPEPLLRRINGRGPGPGGDFQLGTDDCLRIDRPIVGMQGPHVIVREAAVRLSSHCQVCCDCQDFINVYEAERRIRNRLANLRNRVSVLVQQYRELIQKWHQQSQCAEKSPLRVALLRDPNDATRITLVAGCCNTTGRCLRDLYFELDFRRLGPAGCKDEIGQPLKSDTTAGVSAEVVCGRTFRFNNVNPNYRPLQYGRWPKPGEQYMLGGAWPSFWARFDGTLAGYLAYVTAELKLSGVTSPASTRIEVLFQASSEGQPLSECPVVSKILLFPQTICPPED